jgi:hypothetical protein
LLQWLFISPPSALPWGGTMPVTAKLCWPPIKVAMDQSHSSPVRPWRWITLVLLPRGAEPFWEMKRITLIHTLCQGAIQVPGNEKVCPWPSGCLPLVSVLPPQKN